MGLPPHDRNYYYSAVQRLARFIARAKKNGANDDAFHKLFNLRPQESEDNVFTLDQQGQDTVIALGIYLIESGFQSIDILVPYLLKILRSLVKVVWMQDNFKLHETDRIPVQERFSFCLNTLLSDIACFCEAQRDEILSEQVNLLLSLANIIKSSSGEDTPTIRGKIAFQPCDFPLSHFLVNFQEIYAKT